ncbi:hypothetical protein M885DRAFT_31186 [Pelagophyceae sp. CCMP2097]|nr:hypothetical protein M885DRAFT_31186 [Pelagophyceae sp. CCMP2097]
MAPPRGLDDDLAARLAGLEIAYRTASGTRTQTSAARPLMRHPRRGPPRGRGPAWRGRGARPRARRGRRPHARPPPPPRGRRRRALAAPGPHRLSRRRRLLGETDRSTAPATTATGSLRLAKWKKHSDAARGRTSARSSACPLGRCCIPSRLSTAASWRSSRQPARRWRGRASARLHPRPPSSPASTDTAASRSTCHADPTRRSETDGPCDPAVDGPSAASDARAALLGPPAGTQSWKQLTGWIGSPPGWCVLRDIYIATAGDDWEWSDGWSASVDVATWFGVSAKNGRITGVALFSNGLRGELPPSLGSLANLRELLLHHNLLVGAIPTSVWKLQLLHTLDLSSNRFSGCIPSAIGAMRCLEYLNLSSNRLSGEIPPELGMLARLEALHLDHNSLAGALPASLGDLESLELLNVSHCWLQGPLPLELIKLGAPSASASSADDPARRLRRNKPRGKDAL